MKKVHITPKDKSFIAQRSSSEVSLVRAVSLGAVMVGLLSSVSPVFASHLSSTGSTVQSAESIVQNIELSVQSVSAGQSADGVVSAKGGKAGSGRVSGRVGVAKGGRSCGVDQVISRSSSRSGKKISAKEQYKKLTANSLSDGSGDYSFESSCGADASVNALTSAGARSLIGVDAATSDWLLEENNTINWSVNTRSVNTTGARVAGGQTREKDTTATLCGNTPGNPKNVCIGELANVQNFYNSGGLALGMHSVSPSRVNGGLFLGGYNPVTGGALDIPDNPVWHATYDPVSFGDPGLGITRQIVGVAAGHEDTDAVNVAQLKALKEWTLQQKFGFYLSAERGGMVHISDNDHIRFMVGDNIDVSLSSTDEQNLISFGLSQNVLVDSIGILQGGPKMDANGIDLAGERITNMARGFVEKGSTDAVTGAQLYEFKQDIEGLSSTVGGIRGDVDKLSSGINLALGGGADLLNDKVPSYTIQREKREGIEAAFEVVDGTLTQLDNRIKKIGVDPDESFISQNPPDGKISIGFAQLGNEVSIANAIAKARKLTGLAEGDVSDKSTEAVTGKQLFERDETIKGLTSTIEQAGKNVTMLADNLNTALGGEADVLAGKAPRYKILGNNDEGYKGVEAAFKGVDGKLKELDEKIDGVTGTASNALVAQDPSSHIITIGGKAEGDKISLTNSKEEARTLTGLKDGELKGGSKDAVTGAQLHKMGSDISKYLGGGANVLENTPPKYTIQTKDHKDIGSAFAGVDTSLTQLSSRIGKVEENNLVAQDQDEESKVITIGAKVEGNKISITNKSGQARTLTGLAEGSVTGGSTDAVTGAQLWGVQEKLDPLDPIVKKAEGDVKTLNKNINEYLGGANVLAGKAPTYTIDGQGHRDVGSAFAGVDGKLTQLSSRIGKVEENNLVAQDQDEESKVITIGAKVEGSKISITNKKGQARTLTGLAEGKLSAKSTDAVTGKQLWDVQEKFKPLDPIVKKAEGDVKTLNKNVNQYLGGGADVLGNEAPKYTIQKEDRTGVASAFEGVDNTLTVLVGDVDYVMKAVNNSLVEQEGLKITIGAKAEGNEISIAGSAGLRKLTGLADGSETEESTDAVTGKQLYKFKGEVETLTSTVNEASGNVTKLAGNLSAALGGEADVLAGKTPTYKILGNNDEGYKGVEAAFKGVDGKLTELEGKIGEVTGTANNALVAQDKESKVITIGGKAEGDKISILNKDGGSRTLTGLSEGSVTEGSTDAITGAQLFEVEQKFEPLNGTIKQVGEHVTTLDGNINKYLAGGANVLGSEAPTYEVQEREYNSVGAAFEGVDTSLTDLYEKFDGLQNSVGDDSLVAQNKESKLITIGAKVEGNKISITNKKGQARTLTGLAEGSVREGSTEAVTGAQLYKRDETVKGLTGTIEKAGNDVTNLDGNINKYLAGGANVLAGKAPTYKVQKDEYHSVGAAFVGVDSKLTDLYDKLGKVETVGDDSLVAQGVSGVITIGAKVEGSKISITNKKGQARTLTGLAEGDLSEASTEAVTGKQLWDVQEKFKPLNSTVEKAEGDVKTLNKNVNQYLGGADVLAGKEPTYKIQGNPYNNVGTAFVAVDNTLTTLVGDVDYVMKAVNNSLVEQEGLKITIGAKVEGNEISIAGSAGLRKLTGLADGSETEESTDAVTGKQLYKFKGEVETLTSTVNEASGNVTKLAGNLSAALGGEADVLAGKAPTYKILGNNDEGYKGVEAAFKGVDGKLKELDEKIDGVTGTASNALVAQDEKSKVITLGGKAEGDEISILNKDRGGRTLTGLAEGKVEEGSTDAITGKQLFEVDESVKGLNGTIKQVGENVTTLDGHINKYLAGGAKVLAGTEPTYKVQGKEHHDVGSAFVGVDTSLTDLYAKFDGLQNSVGDDSLVAQNKESKLITIGAKVEGNKISITNKSGQARTLTGLAEGSVRGGSTDAVTGAQLYKIDETVKGLNGTIEKAGNDVTNLDGNINKYLAGGANVLAGKAPTYKVQKDEYHSVGAAFVGVDSKLTDLYDKLGKVETVGDDSLVAQGVSGVITIGAKVEGSKISITNKKGQARTLTGLAEGDLSEASTEAVTGKQLWDVQEKFKPLNSTVEKAKGDVETLNKNVNQYLGGADVLAGKAPTYTIQGKEHHNVGTAFVGVDNTLTVLVGDVDYVMKAVNNSLVEQEGLKITIGAKVEGNEISIAGSAGLRKLTGLADGSETEESTDAVTGKQLYKFKGEVETLTSTVNEASGNVTKLAGNLSAALGGEADVLAGKAPTYKILGNNDEGYKGVEAAFKGVDGKLKELDEKIDGVTGTASNALVAQDEKSKVITLGGKAEGDEISILNKDRGGRTLTGLAEGKVEEGSTDAITGKQLFEVDESVKGLNGTIKQVGENVTTLDGHINKYLAGGAKVLAGTEPTYKVQGKEHHDVGSAFVGVDTSLTDLYAKFDGLQNSVGDDSLVAQNKESKLITIGAKVEGNKISITNKSGQARTLTGLAEGSVREGSTEAVTGAQLYKRDETVKGLTGTIEKAGNDVTNLDGNINKYLAGGANVLAGKAPTYKVQKDEYHSVGAAFVGVDSKLTDLYDKLGKVETVGDDSLVAQGVSGVITIGAKVEGSKISITNKKGQARTLTGLAEGDLSEASTEAVTGKQLWDVQEKFKPLNSTVEKAKGDVETLNKNVNQYLGGADVLAGKAPTYTIQGKEHHNVGTAFVGVDNTLTVLVGDVDYVMKAVNNSLVEQEGLKITIGAKVEGNEISIAGSAGLRKLTGLADGSETEESTDAVTGKQLYKFKGEVETLTSTVNEASGNVTKLAGNLSAALGGEADVLAGKAPTYKILGNNDEGYKGVEAAFKGVDGKLKELDEKIDGVTGTASNALVAQDEKSKVITLGGKAEGDEISILNKDRGGRTLTGLAEGKVEEGSTDAITGKQLFEVDESVKGLNGTIKQVGENVTTLDGHINKYLAGGAKVLAGTEPTYKVQGKEHHDVGSAFVGVDTSLTDLYAKFDGLQNSVGDDSLVAQNKESKLITIGAKVEGNKISITNKSGQARTLTGLAEGSVREGSTEAVTGAQLYKRDETVKGLTGTIEKAGNDVTNLDGNINKYLAGGANVLAGKAPTYKVQKDEYHSVGAAFVGVDSKLTDLYDKLGKVETVGDDSLVAQGVSGVITIGAKVEGSKISITNKKGQARTLTGLAEGDLSEASTEAVTGKQLWDVQEKFKPLNSTVEKAKGDVETLNKNVNQYLGGADVLAGKAPTYTIQGKEHHNVGTAFVGVDNTLTVLVGDVDYVMKAVNNSLVEQEGLKITIGAKVEGNEISIAGSAGLRKLTGLADGSETEESTDAVTGKQLYKFKDEVETLTSTVNEASGNVTKLADNLSAALGGEADVLAGKAPTYKILGNNDEGYKGVEAAFKGVDGKLKELDEKIDGVTGTASNALVAQDEKSKVITIGGKAEGDEISILNKDRGGRTLTGLAEGKVEEGSTDAITGAQLYKVDESVKGLNGTIKQVGENVTTLDGHINKYLAGGANVLAGTEPTYKVQGVEHHDVGSAFVGVDTSLTDLYAKFDGLQNSVGDDSLVAQNKESKLITIGAKVEGNKISITNKSGQARTLTGLAEGSVRGGSTDAVTGAQLYKIDETVKGLNGTIEKAGNDVTNLDGNINKYLAGGANVLAGKAPTYKVQKDEYHSVGAAFVGVDSKLTDLYDKLGKVETVGDDSLVAQGVSGVITIGAKVEGSKISITNKKGQARTLTGLAEGDLSEASTEAVTGKQLWDVQEKFKPLNGTVEKAKGDVETLNKNINEYLGGADVLAGKAPTYKIQGNPYNNVGTAFVAVDNTLTQLSNQIDEIETNGIFVRAGGGSLIEQDPSSHIITIGAKVGGDEISIANKDGGERKLTGLKEGKVEEGSTDAITGAQLYKVDESVKGLNGTIKQVGENVTTLDGHINKYLAGGAKVLAGTEPTYKVQGVEHHDVGSAFVGVDTSLTDLYAKFDGLQNSVGDDSLVAQNKESKLITIGAKVEGNKISITNKSGQARTLTGLAEGSVRGGSTDAVTGAQLYKIDETVKGLNSTIEKAGNDVTNLDGNINKYLAGGANVLAGKAPTYKVQKDEYHSVGAAFVGVDSKLTDLYDKLGKVETVGDDSLVAQGVSGVITIGAKVEGSKISITNKKGQARTLTGLAEGDLSEASTEAVTGKQLWDVQEKFKPLNGTVEKAKGDVETLNKNINEYLGGADVLAGKAPTYKIQGNPYNNVGTAFVAVDNTLTQLSNQIDEIETNGIFVRAGGGSLIEQDPSSHIITIGAKVGGDEISIANKDGGERKLTGLKEGKVDKNSTEAVTGKQLFEMNTTIAQYFGGGAGYQDEKWTGPTFTITNFGAQGKNGEQTYHNVADAFGAVNSSMSGLNDRIEKVEQQTSSQVNSDSLNWNNDKNAYDASHDGKDSKITHVAQGDVEQGSTDAVTGHQLWVIDEKINNLEGKVDSIVSEVDIITDGAVVYDKDEQGNKINSITLKGGKEDEPVLIDNVADGKIEKNSKQAVNGGQLHNYVQEQTKLVLADANKYTDEKIENIVGDAVAQANAYTDMKFSALSYKIDSVQKEARQAAAIGLSVSNLRYNDTPGKFSVAFGSGMWRNHSAPAFGAGYTSEDGDIRSNLSVTTSGGHWGVGAGISFTLN